ncbi:thiamine biosynthesis lipoprotein ApbE [Clostridia bacterium]|nr:thiamine biosynthesis lipoprotein ApbE [Clostridia bacterium]
MDTICNVTVYAAGDGTSAETALTAAFDRLKEIEAAADVNNPESELSLVNSAALNSEPRVSEDLFAMIDAADFYAGRTDDALDITIGGAINLWGIGTDHARVPSPNELRPFVRTGKYSNLILYYDKKAVSLLSPNAVLNLGAVAKGYACDEAAEVLEESGVTSAVIDLGGCIRTVGYKPDSNNELNSDWKIAVNHPRLSGADSGTTGQAAEYAAFLSVGESVAVSTSGDYERYFIEDGVRYCHILEPETGESVHGDVISVTVISGKGLEADALSTAFFVLANRDGIASAMERGNTYFRDCSFIFIDKELGVHTSDNLDSGKAEFLL